MCYIITVCLKFWEYLLNFLNNFVDVDVITSVNSANNSGADQWVANFNECNECDKNEPSTTNGLYFPFKERLD